MEKALGIYFFFCLFLAKFSKIPKAQESRMPMRKWVELSVHKALLDCLQPLVGPTFFFSLEVWSQLLLNVLNMFLGTMSHFSRFLTWFSSRFIWNSLKFASAASCYFCVGGWVYTTWSDILFLKLTALNFGSIPFDFFGKQASHCSSDSYALWGPLPFRKWWKVGILSSDSIYIQHFTYSFGRFQTLNHLPTSSLPWPPTSAPLDPG